MTTTELETQELKPIHPTLLTLVRLWIAANQWEAIAQRETERRFLKLIESLA